MKNKTIIDYLKNREKSAREEIDFTDKELGKTIRDILNSIIFDERELTLNDCVSCIDRLLDCERACGEADLMVELQEDIENILRKS